MRCALVSLVVLLSLALRAPAQDAPAEGDLGLPPVDADALMVEVTRLAGELKAEAERLIATAGADAVLARLRAEAKADEAVAFQRLNLAVVVAAAAGDGETLLELLADESPECPDDGLPAALARHKLIADRGESAADWREASAVDLSWLGAQPDAPARQLARLAPLVAALERLVPGTTDCAFSYYAVGGALRDLGDPANAAAWFERDLAISERLAPDSLDLAATYRSLAICLRECGELDRALDYAHRALVLALRLAPDSLDCADCYNTEGNVYGDLGDLVTAADRFEAGLAIADRADPASLTGAALCGNIGNTLAERGDLERALGYYRRAVAIREALVPDSLSCAVSYMNIGLAYSDQGDLERARDYDQRALGMCERLAPGSLDHATALHNLGVVRYQQGDLEAAVDCYLRACAIKERLAPDTLDCAWTYAVIGQAYGQLGNSDEAIAYEQRALSIRERAAPGSTDCAASYRALAVRHDRNGDPTLALDALERAIAIERRWAPGSADHASSCANAALATMHLGRGVEARPLFEEAVTALETARARSASAGEEEARRGFSGQYEWIYRDYIRFLLDQGDAEGAAGISERMRAQGLREALFARVVSTAGSAGAEISAEWERIGGMREALPARIEAARARKDDALVAEIEAERGQLDQDEAALRDRARTESPRLAAILFPEKLGIEALQALLGPEDVALSYVLGKDEVSVLVLTSAGPVEAVKLPVTADEVRAALFPADAPPGADYRWITRIAEAPGEEGGDDRGIPLEARGIPIEARGEGEGARGGSGLYLQPEAMAEACRTLWGNLLAPVADKLGDRKRVLVLPDGVLYTVPWAALTDGDGKTLLERAAVVVLPSLQTLGLLRTEAGARAAVRTDRQELCAVGGAEYPDAPGEYGGLRDAVADYSPRETILAKVRAKEPVGLGPLPFAGMEVLAVGQTLGAYPGILAGPDATEPLARERAPHARYVHFACHGYFDYRNPLDSGLILGLTQANPDDPTADGFLTAEDILGLAFSGKGLDADLVTLSACRTAVGKDSGGEGMIGLTRALMFAGTPTVVSTLWSVADESTKELMTRFYANLKGGMDKAEALRQAQLSLRGDPRWSSPYYWAPFVLWGDWN